MRLLFEKGKQKELLDKERNKRGLTWQKFSKELELRPSKLKTFFSEEVLIDDVTFNKLKLKEHYKKFIVKRLNENWGQSKGGKISLGNLKEIKIPEKNEELAELWGIMLGDGHVGKIKNYKIGVYTIKVTGHSVLDRNYLLNFVKPLMENLFGINARIQESRTTKALNVILDSRKIVDFFEKNEFKAGDKIQNQLKIPNWIKENPSFLAACLRGLHDTDGCFYKLAKQNSYQIGFTNHNTFLLSDARRGLLSLGIGVSSIINNRKYVITKKCEIEKFYKLIGFHNSKHLNKIRMFFPAP